MVKKLLQGFSVAKEKFLRMILTCSPASPTKWNVQRSLSFPPRPKNKLLAGDVNFPRADTAEWKVMSHWEPGFSSPYCGREVEGGAKFKEI